MTFRSEERAEDAASVASSAPRAFADLALELASLGYHPFPCRGKRPLTSDGFKAASRDEQAILHWSDRWPDANPGIACGASGINVLDIDSKEGADPREILYELELDDHPIIWTGEAPDHCERYPDSLPGVRGAHVYLRGAHRVGETTIRGVELRGIGAYVMAPGSIHESGVRYEGTLPGAGELPELPDSVLSILPTRESAIERRPVDYWRELAVGGVNPGNGTACGRNKHCARLAGHLLAHGIDPYVCLELILAWNQRNRPALPDTEVTRVVDSIARREAAKWA